MDPLQDPAIFVVSNMGTGLRRSFESEQAQGQLLEMADNRGKRVRTDA